jgi:branched-chain amino acid aminotransferase
VNGEYLERDRPALRADDRGLLYGDGFFETVRVYGGVAFRLAQHLNRLRRSCRHFSMACPLGEDDALRVVAELLSRNGLSDAYLRVTVTRGVHDGELGLPASSSPTVVMELRPLRVPPAGLYRRGVRLHVSSFRVDPGHPLAGHKSLNYLPFLAARDEACRLGADEALLLSVGGQVVEAATSNLFCVRNGEVHTPPLASGALPGITRQAVLELSQAEGVP